LSSLSQKLWGVTLAAEPDGAVARGFDQAKAIEFSIYAFATSVTFGGPALFYFWRSLLLGVGLVLLVSGAWLVVIQFLRFKVRISKSGIVLERTWAGLRYVRRDLPLTARIESHGMGDWDEDGGWPANRLCEIRSDGKKSTEHLIGTGSMAHATADFLCKQRDRFLSHG
jgi:hypothetical protein